ncbi:MAG: hypothetical protein H5T65_07480, partial [Chloroflexi bacterium]|nr:hypothetical protein [Chloroflexota bacterium]
VHAAVSLAGPAFRVLPAVFPQLAALLLETTRRISAELGYRPVLHASQGAPFPADRI